MYILRKQERQYIGDLPVVPHEAVPEVSKNYLYINQKKNVPIEIVGDMFDHFALRATSIRATFCAELLVE